MFLLLLLLIGGLVYTPSEDQDDTDSYVSNLLDREEDAD